MNNLIQHNSLSILGNILEIDKKAVAIVGSREATEKGLQITEKFVKELVKEQITIVSGLARGIDTQAHKMALKYGGRTLAVLGSGINNIYPPENKKLAYEIVKNGAIISGFEDDEKPLPQNFLARNQLIVKLSLAVLVIEGRKRSGTISTANHAGNEGVEVFAVPGSEACDFLIENGATPVQNAKSIIEYINTLYK